MFIVAPLSLRRICLCGGNGSGGLDGRHWIVVPGAKPQPDERGRGQLTRGLHVVVRLILFQGVHRTRIPNAARLRFQITFRREGVLDFLVSFRAWRCLTAAKSGSNRSRRAFAGAGCRVGDRTALTSGRALSGGFDARLLCTRRPCTRRATRLRGRRLAGGLLDWSSREARRENRQKQNPLNRFHRQKRRGALESPPVIVPVWN
jgi:hypothetical protein